MKSLNRTTAQISVPNRERVLQFGGGNFLRAFVDWMLDVYNEKTNEDLGVVLVTPIERDDYTSWQKQEGLYHVLSRGMKNGKVIDEKHLVKCISRIIHLYREWDNYLKTAENPEIKFIVSNTTEAGIRFSEEDQFTDTPPHEFPAKLTVWLHHRFTHFQGKADAGCIFIPVELILKNGENLRKCILQNADNWRLDESFKTWIEDHNTFCNTLVDRIVPGISRDALPEEMQKIGYEDIMLTSGEAFHFWVIEGPKMVQKELPLNEAGLNVIFTDDLTSYRTRKVRILNGAHTGMVPVGYLYGIETVREAVEDEVVGLFIQQCLFEEIIPSLDMDLEGLKQYANDVLDRFRNPFIRHQLISISLNSISKFKVRVLPSILDYYAKSGDLAEHLIFAWAALLHFYKGELEGSEIPLKDDPTFISYLQDLWTKQLNDNLDFEQFAEKILTWEEAWDRPLDHVEGLRNLLAQFLDNIQNDGLESSLRNLMQIKNIG